MKNFISFTIFLLFAWLGIWWYYSCSWCLRNNNVSPAIVEETMNSNAEMLRKKAYEDSIAAAQKIIIGLSAKDSENKDVFTYSENLEINRDDGNVIIPNSLSGFSKQIADYLGKHQDQELRIYGYENSSEIEKNLGFGLSRANFIKDILIEAGINGDRIVTHSKIVDYVYNDLGIYEGGILLSFNTLDTARIAEIEKGVTNKILYSEFAQKTFTPDATLTNYTLELKNYLQKYPNKTVQIIGHTDDVGKAKANIWYGQQRANNVMKYLITQGVAKNKIKALSEGESNPIAPNDTEENRAKNRRIEIIVN